MLDKLCKPYGFCLYARVSGELFGVSLVMVDPILGVKFCVVGKEAGMSERIIIWDRIIRCPELGD